MTDSDKALMEEKFKNVHEKIDVSHAIIIGKLDDYLKISTEALERTKTVEDQTSVWRWFQRKPSRFALVAAAMVGLIILTLVKVGQPISPIETSKVFNFLNLFKWLG